MKTSFIVKNIGKILYYYNFISSWQKWNNKLYYFCSYHQLKVFTYLKTSRSQLTKLKLKIKQFLVTHLPTLLKPQRLKRTKPNLRIKLSQVYRRLISPQLTKGFFLSTKFTSIFLRGLMSKLKLSLWQMFKRRRIKSIWRGL